jgi:aerobic carbon-monoxide dehydrogenase large subunit
MSASSPAARNAFVGSPVERIEDLRFLKGRGLFVDDIGGKNALHATILRSQIAHGRIRSIDASAARALPGVHAVISAADIGAVPVITMRQELMEAFKPYQQPVIACGKVRYVGEPLAVVIADSAGIAEDALERITVDIETLPVVADRDGARADTCALFESTGTNLVSTLTALRGDAEAAFKDAASTRRERFSVQRFTAVTMEPRGLCAEWDEGERKLTVHGAAKVPFHNRRILAKQMSLPEESIAMIECDVGGGFGVRGEFYPEDFLIPFAARKLGRTVKWTEDRREHLIAANHARDAACELEIACDRDGTIRGLRCPAPIASRTSTSRSICSSPTRRRPAPTAGRAASRRISSANGSSTWRRARSESTGSNSAGAT